MEFYQRYSKAHRKVGFFVVYRKVRRRMTVYEDSGFNIIEDGGVLPKKAQHFKDWYEENMGYAHTNHELNAVLIPPFDYNADEDEFLHVDLDKAYMVWKGAKETIK